MCLVLTHWLRSAQITAMQSKRYTFGFCLGSIDRIFPQFEHSNVNSGPIHIWFIFVVHTHIQQHKNELTHASFTRIIQFGVIVCWSEHQTAYQNANGHTGISGVIILLLVIVETLSGICFEQHFADYFVFVCSVSQLFGRWLLLANCLLLWSCSCFFFPMFGFGRNTFLFHSHHLQPEFCHYFSTSYA